MHALFDELRTMRVAARFCHLIRIILLRPASITGRRGAIGRLFALTKAVAIIINEAVDVDVLIWLLRTLCAAHRLGVRGLTTRPCSRWSIASKSGGGGGAIWKQDIDGSRQPLCGVEVGIAWIIFRALPIGTVIGRLADGRSGRCR